MPVGAGGAAGGTTEGCEAWGEPRDQSSRRLGESQRKCRGRQPSARYAGTRAGRVMIVEFHREPYRIYDRTVVGRRQERCHGAAALLGIARRTLAFSTSSGRSAQAHGGYIGSALEPAERRHERRPDRTDLSADHRQACLAAGCRGASLRCSWPGRRGPARRRRFTASPGAVRGVWHAPVTRMSGAGGEGAGGPCTVPGERVPRLPLIHDGHRGRPIHAMHRWYAAWRPTLAEHQESTVVGVRTGW